MPGAVVEVTPAAAVSFRVAAHGLDRRRSSRSSSAWAAAARIALPDYPKGAARRALAARCEGVGADTLGRALARGTLVRAYSLRGTTHVVAGPDAARWALGALPTPGDEDATRAALGSSWPVLADLGVTAVDAVERVAEEILRAVAAAGAGPRTKGELSEALHDRFPGGWEPWCPRCRAHHVPDLLFRVAIVAGGLRFADEGPGLVAGARPAVADHAAARSELVRRFLGAYGPAPSRAFAEWCGIGPAEAEASFAALGDEVVPVGLGGVRAARLLATDVGRLQDPPVVTGVRLVPAGDPFLHQRDRATLLPDADHRRRLWRPAGAPGLVLLDGHPAGTWRHRQTTSGVEVTADLWTDRHRNLGDALRTEAAAALSPTDDVHLDVTTG